MKTKSIKSIYILHEYTANLLQTHKFIFFSNEAKHFKGLTRNYIAKKINVPKLHVLAPSLILAIAMAVVHEPSKFYKRLA
jgi:hypothetical protein